MNIAVIGAGFSGLISVKSCLEEGLNPTCFEITSQSGDDDDSRWSLYSIGGVWAAHNIHDKKIPTLYDNLLVNTSKEAMTFSDLPMPAEWPAYITPDLVHQHILRYMSVFNLKKYIKFKHEVVKVTPADDYMETGRWVVEVLDLTSGITSIHTFDAVMICSGINSIPYIPTLPGADDFKGKIIHSKRYKNNSEFKDQRVLIVGNASTGLDVTSDICQVAEQPVYMASRRGVWIMRRDYQKPIDLTAFSWFSQTIASMFPTLATRQLKRQLCAVFDYEKYNLLPKGEDIKEQQITVNDSIQDDIVQGRVKAVPGIKELNEYGAVFTDWSSVELDAIILATGYDVKIPYLDAPTFKQDKWHVYEYVWPVGLAAKNTLSLIGHFRAKGPAPPGIEIQARWAVRVFKGSISLPSVEEMSSNSDKYNPQSNTRLSEHISLVPGPYCRKIAAFIGCLPSIGVWTLITKPLLWFKLVFGPIVPYIFRLTGPHRWDEAENALNTVWQRNNAGYQSRT